jgi:hypothetical protein
MFGLVNNWYKEKEVPNHAPPKGTKNWMCKTTIKSSMDKWLLINAKECKIFVRKSLVFIQLY